MPSVSIFLNQSLPLSEIFVYHQAKSLKRYSPKLLACKRAPNSINHDIPEVLVNKNNTILERISEAKFKLFLSNKTLENSVRKTDLIHAHFGPTGWLASYLSQKTNKPLVVTLHGFDVIKNNISCKNSGLLQTIYYKKRHLLAERTNRFICVSNFMKQKAIEFGFPEEKCVVHYMGIPLSKHTVVKSLVEKGSPVRILSVGRLVPVKAHCKLIEAVSYLQQDGVNVHLDIIGDGELRKDLEIQAKNSLNSYTFHGALAHNDVINIMRQSHIYCHTSMTQNNGQAEAFGLAILEASWSGLPVVAFSCGGVSEAVSQGKTGLLCEEGNVRELYKNILHIIKQKDLMQHMSRFGPEFVKKNFCNISQTSKLEKIYDLAIDNL